MKVIAGKKIFFRLMTEQDTDLIIMWRNKEFVKNKFIYRDSFTKEGHKNWIDSMITTGKAIQFIMTEIESGIEIGSVYLRDIDRINNKAEFGIFIGEELALGKGLGSEAATLMIEYAFKELKLHKLYLRVLFDNKRAIKSYMNAGFKLEAQFEDELFLDGKYTDLIFMSVINK